MCLLLSGSRFVSWLRSGDALAFELKQIRYLSLQRYEEVRYLTWVETFADWYVGMRLSRSKYDWDWGDALPSKDTVALPSTILFERRCGTFWVETDSFANWVCGDAFQIRLLFEIKGMRYLLSWYSYVNFWVEADSFADWVCGDALAFE